MNTGLLVLFVCVSAFLLYALSRLKKEQAKLQSKIQSMKNPASWHDPTGQDYVKGPAEVVDTEEGPGVHCPWMVHALLMERDMAKEVCALINLAYANGQESMQPRDN